MVEEDECRSEANDNFNDCVFERTSNKSLILSTVDDLERVVFCEQETAGVSESFAPI